MSLRPASLMQSLRFSSRSSVRPHKPPALITWTCRPHNPPQPCLTLLPPHGLHLESAGDHSFKEEAQEVKVSHHTAGRVGLPSLCRAQEWAERSFLPSFLLSLSLTPFFLSKIPVQGAEPLHSTQYVICLAQRHTSFI